MARTKTGSFLSSAAGVVMLAAAANASANLIDPNFFVCPDGVAIGSCSGDPNQVGSNQFGIYFMAPAGTLTIPFCSFLRSRRHRWTPSHSSRRLGPYRGRGRWYCEHWRCELLFRELGYRDRCSDATGTDGTAGHFTSTQDGGVYAFIGLDPSANSSQNASNFFGNPALSGLLGYTPAFFEIFVYAPRSPDGWRSP